MKEKEKNATVISFVNMKGGVAKTTLSINIAKELSKKYSVLVIDMDPQFNATQSLLFYKDAHTDTNYNKLINDYGVENDNVIQETVDKDVTTAEFYSTLSTNSKTVHKIFCNPDILSETDIINEVFIKIDNNLHLFAGDLELSNDISGDVSKKNFAVSQFLDDYKIKSYFDYIIIDCSPTWSILVSSSLRASDYYIIPSKVDTYSSIGIKLLEKKIEKEILTEYAYKNNPNLNLHSLGIVFTLTNDSVKAETRLREKLTSEYKTKHNLNTFNTSIPYIPSVASRFLLIDEVQKNNKYHNIVNAIEKLTDEIKDKINNKTNDEINDRINNEINDKI